MDFFSWYIFLISLALIIVFMLIVFSNKYFRTIGLVFSSVFIIFLNIGIFLSLGEPRPIKYNFVNNSIEGKIVKHIVAKPYIYLWIVRKGKQRPEYFVLDYTEKRAKKLSEKGREAEKRKGKSTGIPFKYERSLNKKDTLTIHPWPQEKTLPEKHYMPPPKYEEYQHPSQET